MRRVVAALSCLALLGAAGCATSGGPEVAGRASQVEPPPPELPLPSGTPVSADAVAVLRADPEVSDEVRAALVPCEDGGGYPVDDRYADLTGDGVAELVVTVFPCKIVKEAAMLGIGFGLAGFVYDLSEDPPVNLLALQNGGVELLVGGPEHGVMALLGGYGPQDDPCCPTNQHFALYVWNGTTLVETKR
jgi:hypothetical protein